MSTAALRGGLPHWGVWWQRRRDRCGELDVGILFRFVILVIYVEHQTPPCHHGGCLLLPLAED